MTYTFAVPLIVMILLRLTVMNSSDRVFEALRE